MKQVCRRRQELFMKRVEEENKQKKINDSINQSESNKINDKLNNENNIENIANTELIKEIGEKEYIK